MNTSDLIHFDSTLNVIRDDGSNISGLCSVENISEHALVFIKNKKFFLKLRQSLESNHLKNIKVIFEKKFYESLSSDEKVSCDKFASLAVTPSVALSLCFISKPFFHLKMKGINTQVDGRQMGTTEIDPSASIAQNVFIGENVKIGKNVEIMPGAVIHSFSVIEENSKIFSHVTLYPFTQIGKNCRLHSGVVIGSDGYGYTFHEGAHHKIWHMGGVVIHDHVEIGANSCVDMGTFSPTVIGQGTKIDNLVQIAHNVKIGQGCIICGQAGIAGSAILEDYVVMGGRAAIGPDAFIGKGVQIAGGAKVNQGACWPSGSKLGGHPAKDIKEWMRGIAYLRSASLKKKHSQ